MADLNIQTSRKHVAFLAGFIFVYLILFIVIAYQKKNVEFIYYSVIIFILLIFMYKWSATIHLPVPIYVGFALLGLMHVAGGNLVIDGLVLYEHKFGILKYDNIVHPFGIFVTTLAIYNLFKHYMRENITKTKIPIYIMIFLMAMGVGALVEMSEFAAFTLFNGEVLVGDYVNNALDLVFNAIGSIVACAFVWYDRRKKR